MCVDCFGGDLLSFWIQARRFLSRWFCALLVGGTFEPPLHLAPPLEGNLFPSCYCIDVFLFTLQEHHKTVACEGVYRLHEIRVLFIRVSPCDTAGGADGSRRDVGF